MHISMQYHAQKAFTLFSICVARNLEKLSKSLSFPGWLVSEILNQSVLCATVEYTSRTDLGAKTAQSVY
jgi:hypothetical protein